MLENREVSVLGYSELAYIYSSRSLMERHVVGGRLGADYVLPINNAHFYIFVNSILRSQRQKTTEVIRNPCSKDTH
jgi:hypothetical protein